ncbi:NAD(P)H-hydrate dehydratase [Exiguobacterium flavidum]|uniref:NAD(P)H-hydrate dehydratase n=1 Tax=Exiguobacterium flavidum TaxID=2184695 RepID=UPI000DF77F07|nr:NAD(P)H-hydrate dehydratase [Exiguobacterium flavidum]
MICSSEQIRRIDAWSEQKGLPPAVLMERAGAGIAGEMKKRINGKNSILVLCGTGNNGGDGYVVARELARDGHAVTVVAPAGKPKTEHARIHAEYAANFGIDREEKDHYDVIVDAMYGIGYDPSRENPVLAEWIERTGRMRENGAVLYAIDVPSGVPADDANGFTGKAIMADVTCSLHAYKFSAFLKKTSPYYGELVRIDIGLPDQSDWRLVEAQEIEPLLARDKFGHKGTYGTALLVGGSRKMPGSIQMAARACLRAGAGKLQVACPEASRLAITVNLPEAMLIEQETQAISEMLDQATAAGIGPGLDDQRKVGEWLGVLFESEIPLVLDAGALLHADYPKRSAPLVITPHLGEFAKLNGIHASDVADDPIGHASGYAAKHGVYVVLKTESVFIAEPDGNGYVVAGGSSGLAKGGTGDALFGLLTALLAQSRSHYSDWETGRLLAAGVAWYAAASTAVRKAPSTMLATDVIDALGMES